LAAREAGGLRPPLPFFEGCTSSFGEYRRTHFHGGIDFPTRRTVGWPCAAVSDGKVVRVRREAGGYGRVLYLQLDDGRMAVYGHVCRFENARLGIEDRLLAACRKAGTSFPGDVPLDPPPTVKAGETVAYSGDLGVGSPHLHLEIRRGDDLLDPFVQGLPTPSGLAPPQIVGVVIEPLSAGSLVEGSFGSRFYPARPGKGGTAAFGPADVTGPAEAYAVAKDHLGVAQNAVGLAALTAAFDGRPVFSMDLRTISLAHYKDSPLLFAPDLERGGAAAYRLRKLPGFRVAGVSGEGLPADAAPGDHALTVRAEGRSGRTAAASGTLRVRPGPGAEARLSLPGSRYVLKGVEVVPAGLRLRLERGSSEGATPLLVGSLPVRGLRVLAGRGTSVEALVPRESLPGSGAALSLDGRPTGWLAAAGPGRIATGPVALELPDGAVGLLRPGRDDFDPGTVFELRAGPHAQALRASVTYPGVEPKARLGVWRGRLFLDNWTGKAVPFRGDGTYGLRSDLLPPVWGKPRLERIPHQGDPQLVVGLSDGGTGPDLRSLSLFLDGQPAFADWDPDTGEVRVDLSRVPPGTHTLSGRVRDFAGNAAELPPAPFRLP
jgi:hypothetical protein